jgi:hypothetical protein
MRSFLLDVLLVCIWMDGGLVVMKFLLVTVVVCLLFAPASGFSQTANGRITGTVTDATGAVIPGVMVEVTNTETGVVFSTLSTETGDYSAPNLPPGPYSISASLPGFKHAGGPHYVLGHDGSGGPRSAGATARSLNHDRRYS